MYHHLHLLFLFPISFFFLEQNKTKTNKQNICLKCSIITDAESYLYDESKSIRQPIKPSDFLFFSLRNSYHLPFIYLFLYSLSDKRNIERKLSFVVARFSGTLSKRLERESNLFSWLSCRDTSNTKHTVKTILKKHSSFTLQLKFYYLFIFLKKKNTFD